MFEMLPLDGITTQFVISGTPLGIQLLGSFQLFVTPCHVLVLLLTVISFVTGHPFPRVAVALKVHELSFI
jgi:hypothetical protein